MTISFLSGMSARAATREGRVVLRVLAVWCGLLLAGGLGLAAVEELAVMSLLVLLVWSGGLLACAALAPSRPALETALHRCLLTLLWLDLVVKGFLRGHFGLRPNHSLVIESMLATHTSEALEFLALHGSGLLGAMLFAVVALLPAVVVEAKLGKPGPSHFSWRLAAVAASLLLLGTAAHANKKVRLENPLLAWPLRYMAYQSQMANYAQYAAALDAASADSTVAKLHDDPRTLVLVLGESSNRMNWGLYGYARETTPRLSAMQNELLIFKDANSSDSSTQGALQRKLTPASLERPGAWTQQPDILTLARTGGYKVWWISNHVEVGDGFVSALSRRSDVARFVNKGYGRSETPFDEALIPELEAALASPEPRKLIVLHTLGSHPQYNYRYPASFNRFTDTPPHMASRSRLVQELRNQYDNSVLYTDHVLGEVLGRLKVLKQQGANVSLLFVSDHGQEVGHFSDHVGHSVQHRSGFSVPMLAWGTSCLTGQTELSFSTDSLDDVLEHLLGIEY